MRMRMFEDMDFVGGGIVYRHDKERYMRDPELREAYMCGRKEAYKEIMEEKYGQRGGMNYRDDDWEEYEERRRRDRYGRYR